MRISGLISITEMLRASYLVVVVLVEDSRSMITNLSQKAWSSKVNMCSRQGSVNIVLMNGGKVKLGCCMGAHCRQNWCRELSCL